MLLSDLGDKLKSALSVVSAQLMPGTPEFNVVVLPMLSYWLVAALYDALDTLDPPMLRRYRVTRKQRGRDNMVTKANVVQRVLLQHACQLLLGLAVLMLDPGHCSAKPARGWALSCMQFGAAMLFMDAWQFWIHRWMHVNTYLYKHIHSHHHRLLIPYAYGALYNHPLEGFLLDTLGGLFTLLVTNMGCQVSVWFLNFATIKTVLDHCGWRFPLNPLHDVFPNNAAYHDVHHDLRFIKKNYSQPFFTYWDRLMGSYMSPQGFHIAPKDAVDAKGASSTNGENSESRKER